MQIIAELEGAGRGAYTGSLGYLTPDGRLDVNILIRTMTLQAGHGAPACRRRHRGRLRSRARARGDARQGARAAAPRSARSHERPRTPAPPARGSTAAAAWSLSVFDRGLHYGDGLFETIACLNGQPRFLDRHLERLAAGCARLGLLSAAARVAAAEIGAALEDCAARGPEADRDARPGARRAATPSPPRRRRRASCCATPGRPRMRALREEGVRVRLGGAAARGKPAARGPEASQPARAGPGAPGVVGPQDRRGAALQQRATR